MRVAVRTSDPNARTPWYALAAIAALYFGSGKFALYFFASVHASASSVWPPTGFALAALLIAGYDAWPAIFVGAFFVNATTAGNAWSSLGIACGNTLEAVAGAYLINRFAGGLATFERANNIFRFAALTAFVSALISPSIGVLSLALAGYADWGTLGPIWLTWWLGDTAGALVVAPLIIVWYTNPRFTWRGRQLAELVAVLSAVVLLSDALFVDRPLSQYPLSFLCIAPLAWIAVRFGEREVTTAIALITCIATWATDGGAGPFVLATRNESLLVLQVFLVTLVIVSLPMAALVREKARLRAVERHARQAAEAANRTKDEFLAMLSHELRNPLAAITAGTGVLRYANGDPELARHSVEVVARQTQHLARLVDDLLDVSRITSGKITLAHDPVQLTVAIARGVEAAKPVIDARGHGLQLDLAETPAWVTGDLTRLTQVVLNLLINAAKYTPDNGTLTLSLRTESNIAVLRVRDSGLGMAADQMGRVFDLFSQGERTLDRSEGGLGIGLTVARRIIELHGGTIEAFSEGPGRGSEFVVRLPLTMAPFYPPKPRAIPSDPSIALPRRRVLLVDDNVDAANSIAALLKLRGNDVRVAYDGPSAMTVAGEFGPDVALVDIGLPGMNGYDLARELPRGLPSRPVQLIAMSGYGRDEDVRRSQEAGFIAHLVKPVLPEELDRLFATLPQHHQTPV